MDDIKIGTTGQITEGDDSGMFVRIIRAPGCAGAFQILVGKTQDLEHGYDHWVKDEIDLAKYFRESRWKVDWTTVK